MKTTNTNKEDLKKKARVARKLAFTSKQSRMQQNQKRLRFVQSVQAGHVRGGHSFH